MDATPGTLGGVSGWCVSLSGWRVLGHCDYDETYQTQAGELHLPVTGTKEPPAHQAHNADHFEDCGTAAEHEKRLASSLSALPIRLVDRGTILRQLDALDDASRLLGNHYSRSLLPCTAPSPF